MDYTVASVGFRGCNGVAFAPAVIFYANNTEINWTTLPPIKDLLVFLLSIKTSIVLSSALHLDLLILALLVVCAF